MLALLWHHGARCVSVGSSAEICGQKLLGCTEREFSAEGVGWVGLRDCRTLAEEQNFQLLGLRVGHNLLLGQRCLVSPARSGSQVETLMFLR